MEIIATAPLRLPSRFCSVFALFLGLCSGVGRAATWTVDPVNGRACTKSDRSCRTISAAIFRSSSGDTIQIVSGTYKEVFPVIRKDLA